MDEGKDIVFEALYRYYLAKFRKRYIRKKIENKNIDLIEKRREVNREIKKLKESLKNTQNDSEIAKIVKAIREKEKEIENINKEIENKSKFEVELYKEIDKIEKELQKQIRNYFKGIIFREVIEKPVDLAIQYNKKEIGLTDLVIDIKIKIPDEGEKPEGSNQASPSPSKGEVKISPSGAVRGVGGFFKIFKSYKR